MAMREASASSPSPVTRPAAVAGLLEDLAALERAYSPGHHGRWSARRRAALVDPCVRTLFEGLDVPPRVAVAALGGYGRGELAPASDIDLMVLHGDRAGDGVKSVAEALFYPLWDAGFQVGHAVRSPKQSAELAGSRLDAATALLDARLVAGDPEVFDEMRRRVLAAIGDPAAFVGRLREAAEERRERFGSVSHLLEPDLKEGAGGLRDINSLGWVAAALAGDRSLRALEAEGLLRRAEREAVEAAEEYLTRLRSALHIETGRKSDRLHLEQQSVLASAMGFLDEPGLPAVDGLMRATFEHARQVEHVVGAVFDRVEDRRVRRASESAPAIRSPEQGLAALAAAATSGGPLSAGFLDEVEAAGIGDVGAWTSDVRDAFLTILRSGRGGVAVLEAMDRIGLLARLLPEWDPIRCRPQRDPYHRFTVDTHLLETLGKLSALLEEPGDDPVARRAVEAIEDRDGLLLGALLHDVGKTGRGRHVPVGAKQAAAALARMGVPERTRDLAQFLVEQHLLLADTATRRDLEEENLVLDVAARIGSTERLAALYLLTAADAAATGPLAWTPWRATLVRELTAKVEHVLERGEMGTETAGRLASRVDEVRRLLAGEDPAAVDRFLERMPRGYLLSVPPVRIASHLRLVGPELGALEVRTLAEPGTRPRTHSLTVVAHDRPGLLSRIAGSLSLSGLSILTAQVFTTEDGAAVDVFEVEGAFEGDVDEERWRRFRQTLRRAAEGRLSLEYRVREKRALYPGPRREIPVEVHVDNEASDFFTVIEVGAADRVGLLFDITRTLFDLGLDVHLAKVATYDDRVIDAFYVRDALGRKVEDDEHRAEIERAITAALAI